jgi:hypothetical protein
MAKDSSSIINIALIGGTVYLAWQWWSSQPATASGASAPAPTPPVQPTTPTQPTQPKQPAQLIPKPPDSNPTPPATPTIVGGQINGVPYSGTKGSYTQAVLQALQTAASGSQSQTIDQWNWFMANQLGFVGFDAGVIDPDQVIGFTGTGRFDAISPVIYVNALQTLGLLPYPSGLTGLAALAAGINRINTHPLALRAPGNWFYPKPRKVVM